MLHRINLPACTTHLDWIVQLQCDLIHALCAAHLTPADVTSDWVIGLRTDVDEDWMRRLCEWSKSEKSMRDRMCAVADLADGEKQVVIAHYEANLQFPDSFDDIKAPPPTASLPGGLSGDAAKAYREFFEMFYAPIFYRSSNRKGYPVEGGELERRFSKSVYLDAYHAANPHLAVCPLCDGSMDGAELDHWLAKDHLPELNCHPKNLVEICQACNDGENKGQELTLDQGTARPFENWGHPHLRSMFSKFAVNVVNGHPRLVSGNGLDQARLNNFGKLVKLGRRWANERRNQVQGFQRRLRGHKRRYGTTFEADSLQEQLDVWLTEAEAEQGLRPHKLLEASLVRFAKEVDSSLFAELLQYVADID